MTNQASIRKTRLAQRSAEKKRNQWIVIGIIVLGGLLLIAAAISAISNRAQTRIAFEYRPEDIAREGPFTAIHEMEEGPPIPYLPQGEPQPVIAVNEDYFDFGSIGATEMVSREFIIANTGEGPLTISRAFTTCGCTEADFSASVIQPGEVATVTLRLDAGFHDVRGQTVRRGIIIESNDPRRPQTEIWIQASVSTQ